MSYAHVTNNTLQSTLSWGAYIKSGGYGQSLLKTSVLVQNIVHIWCAPLSQATSECKPVNYSPGMRYT